MRFIKNGSLITVDSVSDWSSVALYPYVVGDLVNVEGINYYCILNHTDHSPPNATYWYPLSGFEYSIPTPYTTALLADRGAFSWSQNTSEMKIAHTSLLPRKLVRTSDTNWTLTAWNVDVSSPTRYGIPTVNQPGSIAAGSTGTGTQHSWTVTAVTDAGEESLVVNDVNANSTGTVITWAAATFKTGYFGTIRGYNIYHRYVANGDYYLEGFSQATSFTAPAAVIPPADTPTYPKSRAELNTTPGVGASAGGLPKRVGEFQQRTLLGNFTFNTQAGYASQTGVPQLFTRRYPALDTDSILFQVRGAIRHFLDIGALVVFADTGEWIVEGNSNGSITPTAAYPKQFSYYGAHPDIPPVVIGADAIYVQSQGSIVRALGFDSQSGGREGLRDTDLTAFAEHLFEGRSIRSMAYQKTPHSIIWVVLDNGDLLSCTYIKDQQILAWCRHETDGDFEEVCCATEGTEHVAYVIVKRSINGSDVRYMEKMTSREFDDLEDGIFVDSAITFDGRNTGSATMKLTKGTNWDNTEDLNIFCSEIIFSELEVGNEIWLTGSDKVVYRCAVKAFVDNNNATVRVNATVPVAAGLRDTAVTTWARAVDDLSGLDHLEGKKVSVQGDGYTVANPNLASLGTALTVTTGAITLPQCHAVIHVGLPYLSDIETLDVDTAQGESLIGKKKLVTTAHMHVQDTGSVWVGAKPPTNDSSDPLEGLAELKIRETEDWYTPNDLVTDVVEVCIEGHWNSNGRVFIRQVNPEPMTILSIAPSGLFPFRGGN